MFKVYLSNFSNASPAVSLIVRPATFVDRAVDGSQRNPLHHSTSLSSNQYSMSMTIPV